TGDVRGASGTPFDFRTPKPIGQDFARLGDGTRGYDHNWCLSYASTPLRPCAIATDPVSGRRMTLATTEPGVQFYTGGYVDDTMIGKGGKPLCRYAGFTLETQKYPGSPNWPQFPSSRLNPGQTYHHTMEFTFDTVPA
ncbi:MAG: galactose mutarotase, partial [Paracoccaceae bacterium]